MAFVPFHVGAGRLWENEVNRMLAELYALGGGGLADGVYGEITVSGSGLTWTVDKGITLDEWAAPVASVDFAQEQAVQFVIENRTSDPGSPVTGQLWIRTDL